MCCDSKDIHIFFVHVLTMFSESTSGEKRWRTQGTFNFLGLPVGSCVLIQIVSCGKRFVADVAAKILVPMRLNMSSHIFVGYQFTTNLAQTFHLGCSEDTIELIRMKYQLPVTYTSIPDWKSYYWFSQWQCYLQRCRKKYRFFCISHSTRDLVIYRVLIVHKKRAKKILCVPRLIGGPLLTK